MNDSILFEGLGRLIASFNLKASKATLAFWKSRLKDLPEKDFQTAINRICDKFGGNEHIWYPNTNPVALIKDIVAIIQGENRLIEYKKVQKAEIRPDLTPDQISENLIRVRKLIAGIVN